jgi:transcriptional regulator with XRE-family HTH domain
MIDRVALEISRIRRPETFSAMLKRLRVRSTKSQNQLARESGCDPAYINRLESGMPTVRSGVVYPSANPRRAIVCAIAESLDLSDAETDRLLFAAGLAPSVDWQARAEIAEALLDRICAVADEFKEDRDER